VVEEDEGGCGDGADVTVLEGDVATTLDDSNLTDDSSRVRKTG
jgi:hypothetical protein